MNKKVPKFSLNSFVVPVASKSSDWYKDINYQDAKSIIKEKMVSSAENCVAIGFYLKHILETEQYKEVGYSSIWECAENEFGFTQGTASRYINICKKFSDGGDSPFLSEKYKNFNKGQLQEMLPIKEEHILSQVTPDMSSQKIRDFRKRSIELIDSSPGDDKPGEDGSKIIDGDFREYDASEDNVIDDSESEDILDEEEASENQGISESVDEKPVEENDLGALFSQFETELHKVMCNLDKLQESLDENGLADAQTVEQFQKYIQEMNFSVHHMSGTADEMLVRLNAIWEQH